MAAIALAAVALPASVAQAADVAPGKKCEFNQQTVVTGGKFYTCRKNKWDSGTTATPLRTTFAKCKLWKANRIGFPVVAIEDGGQTLSMDGIGKYAILEEGLTFADMLCALAGAKAPSYVRTQIENTRAIDGMQEATWGNYKALWNYHPDDGASLIITSVK